jgi:DNA replication protein DnaC
MADPAISRVLADYEGQRALNLIELEERYAHAYSVCPDLKALETERLSLVYDAGAKDPRATRAALRALMGRRAALLKEAGLPQDYLEMKYRCPDCQDTGYVGETVKTRCACFIKRLNEERFGADDAEILKKQSFETFDLDVFPPAVPPGCNLPQRVYMRQLLETCKSYVEVFPNNEKPNMLFYGHAGLGKTFLLNCISGALLARSKSVLRFTAYRLGELFLQKHTGAEEDLSALFEADLLVCDDLGNEPLYNNVTVEYFISVFNERIIKGRHIIVATNLTPQQIQERYGERMVSRLLDSASTLRFHLRGQDIRTG